MGGGGGGGGRRRHYVFKVLCPDALVSSILGTGGRLKEAWQEETGTKIHISKQQEHFPGTRLRLLVVSGDAPGALATVLDRVVERVVRCGDQERSKHGAGGAQRRGSAGVPGEPDFLGKEGGEYAVRAAVPTKTATAVVGPSSSNVQAFRRRTGARVFVDKASFAAHQLLKVVGAAEGLRAALRAVCQELQAEAGSAWYPGWGAVRTFDAKDSQPSQHWYERWAGSASGAERRGRSRTPPRRGPEPSKGGADSSFESELGDDSDQRLLRVIASTAKEAPLSLYVLDEEYTISCELPADRAEAMQGPGGQHIEEVERVTGTRIHFEDVIPEEEEEEEPKVRTLVVEGPVMETYRAHALMMGRYHEVGAEMAAAGGPEILAEPEPEVPEHPQEEPAVGAELEAEEQPPDEPEATEEELAGQAAAGRRPDVGAMRSELAALEARLATLQGHKAAAAGVPLRPGLLVAAPTAKGISGPRPAPARFVQAPKLPAVPGPQLTPTPVAPRVVGVPAPKVAPARAAPLASGTGPASPQATGAGALWAQLVQRTSAPGVSVGKAPGKGKAQPGWLFSSRDK